MPVVGVADEIEAADGEDHLAAEAVGEDEVRGAAAGGGDALDDGGGVDAVASGGGRRRGPAGAGEVGLVGGERCTAGAGDGSELGARCGRPRGAVRRSRAGAAPPRPPRAADAHRALHPARQRHLSRSPRTIITTIFRIGIASGGGYNKDGVFNEAESSWNLNSKKIIADSGRRRRRSSREAG